MAITHNIVSYDFFLSPVPYGSNVFSPYYILFTELNPR